MVILSKYLRRMFCLFLPAVPPKIINLSKDLVVNEGADVTLMCQAGGKPEPSLSWKLISPSGKTRPVSQLETHLSLR